MTTYVLKRILGAVIVMWAVATLVFLLRWLYEPERVRWLLWAFFLFGICFTNHQTLICAAMGIEVLICFGRPDTGIKLRLIHGTRVEMHAITRRSIRPAYVAGR